MSIQLSGSLFYLMYYNVATIVNFIAMWICTGFLFVSLENIPFQFFVFHYTQVESDLGLGGFLSFLVATAAAQAVNFYVQKTLYSAPMRRLQEPCQDISALQ